MLFLRILCTVIVLAYFCGLLVIPACDLLTSVSIPLNPDESCSVSYVVWLGLGPKGGGVRGLQIYHGWANYLAVLQFLPIQNNQDPLSFQAIRILNRLSYEAVL